MYAFSFCVRALLIPLIIIGVLLFCRTLAAVCASRYSPLHGNSEYLVEESDINKAQSDCLLNSTRC